MKIKQRGWDRVLISAAASLLWHLSLSHLGGVWVKAASQALVTASASRGAMIDTREYESEYG